MGVKKGELGSFSGRRRLIVLRTKDKECQGCSNKVELPYERHSGIRFERVTKC